MRGGRGDTIDNQELDAKIVIFYRVPADGIGFVYKNVPDFDRRVYAVVVDRVQHRPAGAPRLEPAKGLALERIRLLASLSFGVPPPLAGGGTRRLGSLEDSGHANARGKREWRSRSGRVC